LALADLIPVTLFIAPLKLHSQPCNGCASPSHVSQRANTHWLRPAVVPIAIHARGKSCEKFRTFW
jgi:hypothetical protein